jgi:hypothetical protein
MDTVIGYLIQVGEHWAIMDNLAAGITGAEKEFILDLNSKLEYQVIDCDHCFVFNVSCTFIAEEVREEQLLTLENTLASAIQGLIAELNFTQTQGVVRFTISYVWHCEECLRSAVNVDVIALHCEHILHFIGSQVNAFLDPARRFLSGSPRTQDELKRDAELSVKLALSDFSDGKAN